MMAGTLRKYDPSAGADDPMPWKIHLIGRDSQGKARVPGATRQSGGARHGSVRRDLSLGDSADHVPDDWEDGAAFTD